MDILSLNGTWKLHWSTGQRGGAPYVYKAADNSDFYHDVKNLPHPVQGEYKGGWLDAEVPGEVHLDLMRQGIIDDPNDGINALKARWVEEMEWFYRRTFDAPEAALCGNAYLYFAELDLNAKVWLNGEEIARHKDSFYPLSVDVSGRLKEKDNELVVFIESGIYSVCEEDIREAYTATADTGVLLTKRMWLRKPQYEAEWDWSPRLMNVGISGDVELRYSDKLVIDHWQIRNTVSSDLASAELTVQLYPYESSISEESYELELSVDGRVFSAKCSAASLGITAVIENPELWYPTGYGEQRLYAIEIKLKLNGNVIWQKNTETGFRRVTVDQSEHPEQGHYFIININNRPVFFKGGNLVPASLFPAELCAEDYEKLTDRAIEANFNMLRIWGGGIYEKDALYDICNRKGILLWQEFISACAYPPYDKDEALYSDMLKEAEYQVRRLSRNPSLVVWCGNNELAPEGYKLYMEDYPEIIRANDPEKYYQPSSPYTDSNLPNATDPGDWCYMAGDQHPWEVGFLNKDHRLYRDMDCRFPNEGGILGPTNRKAFEHITDGSGDYTRSFAYEYHDNTLAFLRVGTSPDDDLKFWTGLLPQNTTLKSYLITGGYVQGEGLSDYIDNFRSRAYSSSAAIFWMFNDCWPCSRSWTVIDNEYRRNMSFYHVKRAFSPIRVVLKEQENGRVSVIGINDSDKSLSGRLEAGVFISDGGILDNKSIDISLPARSVTELLTLESAAAPKDKTGSLPIAFAQIFDKDEALVTRNRLLTHRYFEYSFKEHSIRVEKDGDTLTLISDGYVMGVCLDLDGEGSLSDNLFDLYPGIPYTVKAAGHNEIISTVSAIIKAHI